MLPDVTLWGLGEKQDGQRKEGDTMPGLWDTR